MPELPEVQTVVDDLNKAGLVGDTVEEVLCFWKKSLHGISVQSCNKRLKGKKVIRIWRRAKNIVFDFSEAEHLVIHLRMTGRLHIVSDKEPVKKHEHVVFKFKKSGELRFHDTRKFGRIYCVSDLNSFFVKTGIEPFDKSLTEKVFFKMVQSKKRIIKPLLLDQSFIAGLGNIYVDEALWEAKIHPKRIASDINKEEAKCLLKAIRTVLKRGLRNMGTTLGSGKGNFYSVANRRGQNAEALNVFRRNGLPCSRCGNIIERTVVGQRGTHICGKCQY